MKPCRQVAARFGSVGTPISSKVEGANQHHGTQQINFILELSVEQGGRIGAKEPEFAAVVWRRAPAVVVFSLHLVGVAEQPRRC